MAPIVAALLKAGLPMLASAITNKGQEVIEEKLGVKLPPIAALDNPEVTLKLKQIESDNEEFLLTNATENRKIDLEEFKIEVADRASARGREMELEKVSKRPWWVPSFLDVLTLVIVIGGAWIITTNKDTNLTYAIIAQIASVLAYYYGTTKNSGNKDSIIARFADRKG